MFANSVLGARTDRYGDFIDICAALTGRVPEAGLHLDDNRHGTVLFDLTAVPDGLLDEEVLYPVLGCFVGAATTGTEIPVIDGLPGGQSEDRLKALGAGAASSGAVAMFHAVGSTPEAPDRAAALGGREPNRTVAVTLDDLERATRSTRLGWNRGTRRGQYRNPPLLDRRVRRAGLPARRGGRSRTIDLWVSTGRDILAEVERRGWLADLEAAGVRMVVDTCTYITPILEPKPGSVMTNSAKWAWYAPGNIGVDVVFGSLKECVRSAIEGRVWRDTELWG